ncbi:hypothetical protein H1R20_g4836, partial [Candolleomyces eurysporus]
MSDSLVPQGFGYVGAALLSTVFLLLGQSQVVSFKRRKSGIAYPQMYAEKAQEKESKDALIFNCAQLFSASVCAGWVVSRIFYTRGYITGDPKKRVSVVYGLATVGLLGNLFLSTYVAGGWVMQNLKL